MGRRKIGRGGTPDGPRSDVPWRESASERRPQRQDRPEITAVLFQAFFDQAAVGMVLTDLDGRVIVTNRTFQGMVGRNSEELHRRPLSELTTEDVSLEDERLRSELVQGRRGSYQLDLPFPQSDGSTLWGRMTVSVVCDPAGEPCFTASVVEDITERRRMREELRKSAEAANRLAAIVEASRDAIIGKTLDGVITSWNPASEEFYGYRADEVIGKSISVIIPPDRPDELHSLLHRLRRGEHIKHFETVRLRKDGTSVDVSVSISPIEDDTGDLIGAATIARNISERKRMDAERESLQAQRAQHVLGISHGLRTPLTVIHGQAQLLQQALAQADVGSKASRSAEAILTGSRRMSLMLRDLVDLTNLESGQELNLNLEPLDLRQFLRDLLLRMGGVVESSRVRIEAGARPWPVRADPDRVERIVVNLLSNALRYSDPRTEVTVALESRDGELVVSIIDRGYGIPPERLPHLFEKYRGHRFAANRPESLGLGLYVTHGLVQAHGGRLWAQSRPGMGSTFSFSLPAPEASSQGGALAA